MGPAKSTATSSPQQGKTLYEMLFQNSLDGIMLTSPDGPILDANPAACRIFGRSLDEIVAAGREGLIDASSPRLNEFIAERKRSGKAHGELRARRKNGTLFPIEFSSMLFSDAEGNPRTCLILRDITDRKAAETERDRLIGELQDALARVKTLTGLLPICASCRKIRDEQGMWHPLETYIRHHTQADFTHGICPECRRILYPEAPGHQ